MGRLERKDGEYKQGTSCSVAHWPDASGGHRCLPRGPWRLRVDSGVRDTACRTLGVPAPLVGGLRIILLSTCVKALFYKQFAHISFFIPFNNPSGRYYQPQFIDETSEAQIS